MAGGATAGHSIVLETERLLLRPWRVAEAAVQRELWTERDPRVPPQRRIDAEGRPTVAELEDSIRADPPSSTGLLAFELLRRVWDWNTASRRVLAKVGFTETERTERDPVHGTTLFTTRRL